MPFGETVFCFHAEIRLVMTYSDLNITMGTIDSYLSTP